MTTTFPRWKGDYTPAFVYELSKKLQDNGLDILVIAPHHKGAKSLDIVGGMRVRRFSYFFPKKYETVAYGGGLLYNLKISNLAKIQVPFFCLSELYLTVKTIRKENIDLIHSHWLIPNGFIGAVCKKLFGTPHVISIHGSDINSIKKSKLLRQICLFIIQNSSWITTNSNYTKKMVLSIDPTAEKKVSIVPMGVDNNFLQADRKSQTKYPKGNPNILSVGELVESKGINILIHAMKDVITKFPDAKLLIVGEGPERKKLETLVKSLDLYNNIVFTGSVDHSLLPSFYTSSDVFVLPSQNVDGIIEGLGVVLLEAMACRTPVIGSDIGGIKDIIVDNYNGFLFTERSHNELSDKIIELLSNPEIAKKFSNNGFNTIISKFTWDSISSKFVTIYSQRIKEKL